MTGHGGKSSLSTQEVRRVDSKYCRLLTGPRIQQIRAQNWGKSGDRPPIGGGGVLLYMDPVVIQLISQLQHTGSDFRSRCGHFYHLKTVSLLTKLFFMHIQSLPRQPTRQIQTAIPSAKL